VGSEARPGMSVALLVIDVQRALCEGELAFGR
jgi:nicotinamidase-related amidase